MAAPLAVVVLHTPVFLRAHLSVYDAGLQLTLSRFVGLDTLPYRDLWTLYGPGPPLYGSIVMDLFGRGVGPQMIALFLVHILIVAAAYLLARRFVGLWIAGILAALVAAVEYAVHFQQTLLLLLWGVWCVLRASDHPARAPRWLTIAAALLGLTFWGRFEFAVVGVVLVLGLWLSVRGRFDERTRRRILLAGLTPPAAFLVYVLVVVGADRSLLNLVDYPFFRYAEDACRGLQGAWGVAFDSLTAPLRGHLWTTEGLILWTTTFLAPLMGILCLLIAVRGRRLEPLRAFAIASVGALLLILWIEHRPRAGESPYPLLPMMAVAAAVLLGSLARHRPSVARWTSVGLAGLVVVTLATSWVAPAARAWTGWPAYDRLLGWEGGRFEGLYDERVWAEVASSVQARAAPGEGIFVALTNNSTRHHANAPIFYWYTDRPPASRFIEFNPCLTDTDPVQREIVADLADVDVVVATTFFPDTRTRGSTVLDAYLRANFQPVYRGELPKEQAVVVLERTR